MMSLLFVNNKVKFLVDSVKTLCYHKFRLERAKHKGRRATGWKAKGRDHGRRIKKPSP